MAGLGGTLLVIGDLNPFQPNVTGGRGRVLTFDESALIDEALALGDKLSKALARGATGRCGTRPRTSRQRDAG